MPPSSHDPEETFDPEEEAEAESQSNDPEDGGSLGSKAKTKKASRKQTETSEAQEERRRRLLGAVRRLEVITRRKVESLLAGEYRSAFKGRGMSFDEVRPYQLGDEVRWIDWNVSARMGDVYVKTFLEERERTMILMWDASRSMEMATSGKSKREISAEVAMLMALSAIKSHDKVGMLIFHDRVERFLPPRRGRRHVLRMVAEILDERPRAQERPTTDLSAALAFLQGVAPRHSIVCLISDLLCPIEIQKLQVAAQKYEIFAFVIRDPLEVGRLPSLSTPPSLLAESPSEEEARRREDARALPDRTLDFWISLGLTSLLIGIGLWQGGLWLLVALVSSGLLWAVSWFLQSSSSDGLIWLRGLEDDRLSALDLSPASAPKKLASFARHQSEELDAALRQSQIDGLFLQTDQDYLLSLTNFLRTRRRPTEEIEVSDPLSLP